MMGQEPFSRNISKLRKAMEIFRSDINEHATVQVVQAFLLVCEKEGRPVTELAEMAGATKTTMSRHLLDLSEKLRNGADGYKVLTRTNDPSNMRSVVYSLSPKGRLLRNRLVELMED